MSGSSQKWLIGCGVVGGLLAVLLIALVTGGFFLAKRAVGEFKETAEVLDQIKDRYGAIEDFRPEAEGQISASRVESFLRARQIMADERIELESSLETLSAGEKSEGDRPGIFRMIRSGVGLLPEVARFFAGRNRALLEADMGLGEYCYIYTIAYFSWLGKSPADGPSFQLASDDEQTERDGGRMDEFEVRERRRERTLLQLNRSLLAMLRNQLVDLKRQTRENTAGDWEERLSNEIRKLESDSYRLPWADGLPGQLEASLRPFEERLEKSYSKMCNALETGLQ
jgi:hypothetical protein